MSKKPFSASMDGVGRPPDPPRGAEACLDEVLAAFDIPAGAADAVRSGQGHVNDTFIVTVPTDGRRFVVQRISPAAFKRPDQVMENVIAVTEYLGREIEKSGLRTEKALHFLRPRTGGLYYTDRTGGPWRAYPYVERTICCQAAETPELFAASGRAFGRFQRLLRDYPAQTLHETIPRFHDTEDRLAKLKAAVAADPMGRAAECGPEISFLLAREADCSVALQALRNGELPLRVTHNDTKLNNVLLDQDTGEGVCIIDLDTVMPGLAINDFGDSIRFGANHSAEDERDLSRVSLDLDLFEAYTRAFLEGTGDTLTEAEIAYLPWGARLMTLECGMRFLTDYLEGDVYFHTDREKQNLDRCRTQCKLVRDMEEHWEELVEIVDRCRRSPSSSSGSPASAG